MTTSALAAPRFPGVEGLRGLAATAVLLSHVHLYGAPTGEAYDLGPLDVLARTGGTAGVVLFFTLSGFLLYRPFVAALLSGSSRPRVRDYLRRRLLRVLPGYWFALLGAGLVLRTTYLPPLQVEGRSLAAEPGVLLANLLLLQGYSPSTSATGIGPAWSLVVEMAFYLVLPLLAALAAALAGRTAAGRRRPWLAALAPAGVLLLVGQAGWQLAHALPAGPYGTWAGSWHAVVARSFLAHAGVFAAGLVLAVLHTAVVRGDLRLPRRWRAACALTAWSVLLPALLAFDRGRLSENTATLAFSVSAAALLALVVLPRSSPSVTVRLLACRPLAAWGLVSYGVFLWNEPVVWLLRRQGWTSSGHDGFALALLGVLVVSGALAALSWRLVERPALASRLARSAQPSARSSSTVTSANDATTSRRGAGAMPTPATLGTATTAHPAASPLATPAGESSSTTHRDGSTPSRAAADR